MVQALVFAVVLLLAGGGGASSSAATNGGGCASEKFSSNRVYASCIDLPRLLSSLHWTYDEATGAMSLAFVAPLARPEGWVAWAINPTGDGMVGAQALVAFRQSNGSMDVRTYNVTDYSDITESPILYEPSELAAEYTGGAMRMFGTLRLPKGTAAVKQVWQVGAAVANGAPQAHEFKPQNLEAKGTVDLVKSQRVASSSGVSSTGGSLEGQKNVHG